MPNKKVAVVYLCFHSTDYLPDVVEALQKLSYPQELVELVIVDNPHPVHGLDKEYLEKHVLPLSGKELPHITYLPQKENTGFAGGMNAGGNWAIANGFDYVFYHNADGSLAPDAITNLVEAMKIDPSIGVAQSLILLDPDKHLINSSGNAFHFLGFGYSMGYRNPVDSLNDKNVHDVPYASGAAVMIPTTLLKEMGGWDNDFFLYHEDTEISFRARMRGKRVVCVRSSVFYHKYRFSKSVSSFYWMERNRYAMLLLHYRLATLILIAPLLVGLEAAMWLFALKGGWVKERVNVWKYWLQPKHLSLWLQKRKKIQAERRISDAALLQIATGSILFQEETTQSPIVTKFANPILEFFLAVLRVIVRW